MKRYILLCISTIILSYIYIDNKLALFLKDTPTVIKEIFEYITRLGQAEFYLIPAFILFLIYRKKENIIKYYSIIVLLSIIYSGIFINILKFIFARYRPTMLLSDDKYGFIFFKLGYHVNSFPSGHTTTAYALSTAFSLFFPKYRVLFFIYATLIGASRIIRDVHYLSDVLAGACIGSITTILIYKHYVKKGKLT